MSNLIRLVPLALLLLALGCASVSGSGVGGNGNASGGTNSWETVHTPASVTSLAFVSVSSSGTLFIADHVTGFWRSADSGASWSQLNSGIAGIGSTSQGRWIWFNPATGTLLCATAASGGVSSGGTVVFYRSTNQGDSWTQVGGTYNFHTAPLHSGAVTANNGNVIFGGFTSPFPQDSVGYSSDDGLTYTPASTSPTALSTFSVAVHPTTHDIWMGTEAAGLYKSTDNGVTYSQIPGTANVLGDNLGFAVNQSGQLLSASQRGVFRSATSSGTSWIKVLDNANTSAGSCIVTASRGEIFYGHRADASNPTTIYESTDGGTTWTGFDSGLKPTSGSLDVESFAINPLDGRLYATAGLTENSMLLYRTVRPVQ